MGVGHYDLQRLPFQAIQGSLAVSRLKETPARFPKNIPDEKTILRFRTYEQRGNVLTAVCLAHGFPLILGLSNRSFPSLPVLPEKTQ